MTKNNCACAKGVCMRDREGVAHDVTEISETVVGIKQPGKAPVYGTAVSVTADGKTYTSSAGGHNLRRLESHTERTVERQIESTD